MNSRDLQSEFRGQAFHVLILIVGMGLLSLGSPVVLAQEVPPVFKSMDRFNPDKTWRVTNDEW